MRAETVSGESKHIPQSSGTGARRHSPTQVEAEGCGRRSSLHCCKPLSSDVELLWDNRPPARTEAAEESTELEVITRQPEKMKQTQ